MREKITLLRDQAVKNLNQQRAKHFEFMKENISIPDFFDLVFVDRSTRDLPKWERIVTDLEALLKQYPAEEIAICTRAEVISPQIGISAMEAARKRNRLKGIY
jgi:hypothetical protein